ncbi:MAG TPA: hypothetical protein VJ461_00730, partial [Candidatus Nanoarchaeia archaeon]|nr:hypothetical protein [Candidatus Nanoarchaeia archaeon]
MAKKEKQKKEKAKNKKIELEEEIKIMEEEITPKEAGQEKPEAPLAEEKILAPVQPEKEEKEESKKKEVVKAIFARERILTEAT